MEVPPHGARAIIFNWEGESSFDPKEKNEYKLYIEKQSGIKEIPVEIEILENNIENFKSDTPYHLTNGGVFNYNTVLTHDFYSSIVWKN